LESSSLSSSWCEVIFSILIRPAGKSISNRPPKSRRTCIILARYGMWAKKGYLARLVTGFYRALQTTHLNMYKYRLRVRVDVQTFTRNPSSTVCRPLLRRAIRRPRRNPSPP
jgi:hypothetical protein